MKKLKSGVLIVFEGIDGSGKTTLLHRIGKALINEGFPVLTTREPGATEVGQAVRAMVQKSAGALLPVTEFLLFAADRAEHMAREVLPALRAGMVVLSDRMADSSLVYQGYGRGIDITMINQVNAWAMQGVKPTATVYLALDHQTAYGRMLKRGGQLSAFDREKEAFFQKVIDGYEHIYADRPDVIRIDATAGPDDCFAQTYHQVLSVVNKYE